MSEGKKTKIVKIIAIVVSVVLVVMLGVSAFWIYSLTRPAQGETAAKEQVGPIYETEEFTVNLSASVSRYIKARFALELNNAKVKDELGEKMPLLQDTIIMVLSGQTLDVLSTVEGKEQLKITLIKAINSFLEKGQVTKIYYKTFIFS